jgi:hypothetical protein
MDESQADAHLPSPEETPLHEQRMDETQARVFGAWLNRSLGETLNEIKTQAGMLAANGHPEEAQYALNAAKEAQQLVRDFRSAPEITLRPGQGDASPDILIPQYNSQEHPPVNPPLGPIRIEGNAYKLLSQGIFPRLNNIVTAMANVQFVRQGPGVEAATAITERSQKIKETADKLKSGYKGIHLNVKDNDVLMLPLIASQQPASNV